MNGRRRRAGDSRSPQRTRLAALTSCLVAVATMLTSAPALAASATTTTTTTTLVVTGKVEQVIVDPANHSRPASTLQFLNVDGRLLTPPAGSLAGTRPGQQVRITLRAPARMTQRQAVAAGAARTDGVVVAGVTPLRTVSGLHVAGTTQGVHTMTILPVYWSSPDAATQASLAALGTKTHDYWAAQSGGSLDLQVTTKDWKRIADPGSCNSTTLYNSALAAHGVAAPANVNQHVLIYFPYRSDCGGWVGLGSVSGSIIWVNGWPYIDVSAHEFGHNLGIGHANQALCTTSGTRVAFSGSCTINQYYDTADVMGFATYNDSGTLNSAFADWLGLAKVVTASASSTTTADLAPLQSVSATRAIKIAVSGGTVYVDYRPAVAPDTRVTGWAGVQLHYLPSGSYPQTQLLDLQPDRSSSFQNANLPVYGTWAVPGANLAVRVNSVSGSAANVTVAPAGGDTTAPAKVTPLTPAAGGSLGNSGLVSWSASTDSGTSGGAAAGMSAYSLYLDGAPAGATTLVAPDATSVALPAGLAAGAHTLRVDAVDTAGNVATGTTVTFTETGKAPDGTPTITSPVAGALSKTAPALSWSVTPASAAAVVVDGSVAGTVASGVTSYSLAGLADGQHSVVVRSVDGGGATTATSSAVSFTLDSTPPTAPSSITYSGGKLSWTASSDATSGVSGYTVVVDGTSAGSTASATLTLTLSTGTHTVVVTAADRAGNTAGTSVSVKLADTTAPSAPGITSPGASAVLGSASQTVSWTAAADGESGIASYTVRAGDSDLATVSGSASSTRVTLPEGKSSLTVVAANGDGLTAKSAAVAVVVDTTAPAAVTKLALSTDGRKLSWASGTDAGTARHYDVAIDGAGAASVTTTYAAMSLSAGSHTFSVTAVDLAGNASQATTLTLWYDPSGPAAVTITSPAGGAALATRSVTLRWNAASDSDSGVLGYRLSVNGKASAALLDPSATSTDLALAEGKNTLALTAVNLAGTAGQAASVVVYADTVAPAAPKGLALSADGSLLSWSSASNSGTPLTYAVSVDSGRATTTSEPRLAMSTSVGQHTFSVTATDAAGNASGTTTLTLWFDPTSPTTPRITTPSEGSYATSTTVNVAWTAATEADGTLAGYRVSVDGKAAATTDPGTRTADVKVGQGSHTIAVTAVNMAGLAGGAASVTVVVDSLPPSTPTALVKAADGTALTWKPVSDKGTAIAYLVSTDGGTAALRSDPVFSLTGSTVAQHTWTVTARDAAGDSSGSATLTGWYDTTAPSAPTVTGPTADAATNSATVTWSGGSDAGSGIAGYRLTVNGTAVSALAGAGVRSYKLTSAKDGAVTVTVAAVNQAGLSSAATERSFVLDRKAPTAPKTVTASTTLGSGESDTITWSAATDAVSGVAGYVLYLDGAEYSYPDAGDGSASVTTPSGAHVWSVAAFDAAGNQSKATRSVTVFRDDSAPSAPAIVSPVSGSSTAATKVTAKWSASVDGETPVTGYVVTVSGATSKTITVGAGVKSATVVLPVGDWTITVSAHNAAGLSSDCSTAAVTVTSAGTVPKSTFGGMRAV